MGAAQGLLESIGGNPEVDERLVYKEGVAAARAQLDDAAWNRAWDEGRSMMLEQAVGYALEEGR